MHVDPQDAGRFGLADGEPALLHSRTGSIEADVEITTRSCPEGAGGRAGQ